MAGDDNKAQLTRLDEDDSVPVESERKDQRDGAGGATQLDPREDAGGETRLDAPGDASAASATQLDAEATRLESGSASTQGPAFPSGSAVELNSGDLIAQRFLLEEELGHGGMSVIYRAKDLIKERAGDPNPFVALKILNGDFSQHPEAWIALQQEISKTQSLAHPRIVTVHDFQIDNALGLPFAQMEEMRGESLQQLIDRNPKGLEDPARVADIIMAIAEGLAYAHTRGIVHADMKPANVFVTQKGEIKILDFGIARFIPGSREPGERPSNEVFGEDGMNALTPYYATPEAFAGEATHPSDDLFALGIIAILLATGKHPFAAVLNESQPSVAAAEQGLTVKRIPGLTAGQWKAVAACLSFERAKRPEDGNRFLQRFRPKSKWLKALTALTVVLAIAVVVVVLRAEQKRPEIPFDQLPQPMQTQIQEALDSGDLALRMRDLNGALFYYSDAFDLHPYNARATSGLEEVMEQVIAAPIPTDGVDLRRRTQQVRALLEYQALADSKALQRHLAKLESLAGG